MQAGMIKKTQCTVKPDNFFWRYGKSSGWRNKHPVGDSSARRATAIAFILSKQTLTGRQICRFPGFIIDLLRCMGFDEGMSHTEMEAPWNN